MAELGIRMDEMKSDSIRGMFGDEAQEKEADDDHVSRRMAMLELAGTNDYCY